jgi:hypothetical protein
MKPGARSRRWARAIPGVAIVCALAAIGWPAESAADGGVLRVLFIGNSYTRFNDLPRMVQDLSRSVDGGPVLRTSRETHGGFDLRRHWRRRRTRRRIATGGWDAVVLQDHSLQPIRHPDRMEEYARRFAEQASEAGARLVLFETWTRREGSRAYRRYELGDPAQMAEDVDRVYDRLGRELHASVAPVGRAWERARDELPETVLHRRDGTHPMPAGTYLSACVLYRTLTGGDPRLATWRPRGLSASEAARIRALAAVVEATVVEATGVEPTGVE